MTPGREALPGLAIQRFFDFEAATAASHHVPKQEFRRGSQLTI
jgi:hypothetical protein